MKIYFNAKRRLPMIWIRYRSGLTAAVLIFIFTAITVGFAHARDFTIVSWGGANQQTRSDKYFKPFAKSKKIPFLEDVYLGGWGVFQAMKETGNIPWDVVQVESSELARGCAEGVFVVLDWSRIADPSKLIPEAVSRCGVGAMVWSAVVAFDKKRMSKRPAKLEDFWDLATWPGKRGMRQGPKINLEFALMAEGIPPAEVYRTLRTPEGVDRAFRKLDEIKSALQLWKGGAQPAEWLFAGDVTMSTSYNSRIIRAKKEGKSLDFIWDHAIYAVDSWVVLKGSPHVNTAYEYLKFFVDSDKHLEVANIIASAPTVKDAIDRMKPEVRKLHPLGVNLKTALFMGTDEGIEFWLDNQDALTQRWNAWATRE
jgi:putative spermidine/putrescine transport system substrate-binding protein